MFNLAIDSKLRGCDVVNLKIEDVAPHGLAIDRATVRQKKTGHPVRFELTEQTREAVDDYIKAAGKKFGEFLFASRRHTKIESTVRYLGIEVDDALAIAEQVDVWNTRAERTFSAHLFLGQSRAMSRQSGCKLPVECCFSALADHPSAVVPLPAGQSICGVRGGGSDTTPIMRGRVGARFRGRGIIRR